MEQHSSFLSEFEKLSGGQRLSAEGLERIARFQEMYGHKSVAYQHFLLVNEVYLVKQQEQIKELFNSRDVQNLERLRPEFQKVLTECATAGMRDAANKVLDKQLGWKVWGMFVGVLLVFFFGGTFGMKNFLVRHTSSPTFQIASASIAANALFDAVLDDRNPWILKKLISSGTNVNIVDENGNTPLLLAVNKNANVEVIEALIEGGAGVNVMNRIGRTALISVLLSDNPNLDVVKLLIKNGADVNAQLDVQTTQGKTMTWTLLMFSANRKSPEIIIALVKAGADLRIKNGYDGKTALDIARENPAFKDNLAVLELLGEKPEPKKTLPKK